jgi:hypothetical protein
MQEPDASETVLEQGKASPLCQAAVSEILEREYADVGLEEEANHPLIISRSLRVWVDGKRNLVFEVSGSFRLRLKRLHLVLGALTMAAIGAGIQVLIERLLR